MGVAWGAFNNIDVPVTHSVQAEHCFCPLRSSLKVSSGHFEHNVLNVAVQSLWTLYPVGKNVKICCFPMDLVEEIIQNYFGQQLDNSWVNGLLPPGHARQQSCPALYSSLVHDGDAALATPWVLQTDHIRNMIWKNMLVQFVCPSTIWWFLGEFWQIFLLCVSASLVIQSWQNTFFCFILLCIF